MHIIIAYTKLWKERGIEKVDESNTIVKDLFIKENKLKATTLKCFTRKDQ